MTKAPARTLDQTSDSSHELELKFSIDTDAMSKLAGSGALGKRLCPAKPKRIETTYFDTPDELLYRNGYTMRVRKQANKRILTVKGGVSASIERAEWERPIAS